jgi:hypothetical protein
MEFEENYPKVDQKREKGAASAAPAEFLIRS